MKRLAFQLPPGYHKSPRHCAHFLRRLAITYEQLTGWGPELAYAADLIDGLVPYKPGDPTPADNENLEPVTAGARADMYSRVAKHQGRTLPVQRPEGPPPVDRVRPVLPGGLQEHAHRITGRPAAPAPASPIPRVRPATTAPAPAAAPAAPIPRKRVDVPPPKGFFS